MSAAEVVEARTLEHALCFKYAQIVQGEATCAYCAEPASLVIANGADPEWEPVCWAHWADFNASSMAWVTRVFGPKTEGSSL